MTIQQAQNYINKNILLGKSKEQIFDELRGGSKIPDETIARLLKNVATLDARKEYKNANTFLIVLMTLAIISRILVGIFLFIGNGANGTSIVLFAFSVINVFLLLGICSYSSGFYTWIASLAIIGLVFQLIGLAISPFKVSQLIDIFFSFVIIYLGFYLNSSLFPKYELRKQKYTDDQGQVKTRSIIKFER